MSEDLTISGIHHKKVKVEVIVADVSASIVASGQLTVPPPKPDIASILDTQAQVSITRVSVVSGTVVIQGNAVVDITYVSTAPSQPVHFFEGTLSLFGSVNVPGVFPGMIPEVVVTSVFATSRLINPRTVEVNVLVSVRVKVLREQVLPIVTEVPKTIVVPTVTVPVVPVIQRRVVTVERAVLQGEAQTIAIGTISIPPDKPGVSDIVRTSAAGSVTRTNVLRGKVVVDGVVSTRTLYVALSPSQPVFSVDGAIRFSVIVDLPGVEAEMFAFAAVQIEAVDTTIVNSRTLRIRAVVKVSVVVTVEKDLSLVTGIGALPPSLVPITQDFLVEEIVGHVQDDSTITVQVVVPTTLPGIGRVIQSFAQARITKILVLDGVIIVQGTLRITILFSELPSQRVFATVETVPFSVTLRIAGAVPTFFGTAEVSVVRVVAVPVQPRVANVRVTLRGWGMVTRIDTVPTIVDIRSHGAGQIPPGTTIPPGGAMPPGSTVPPGTGIPGGSGELPGPPVQSSGQSQTSSGSRVHIVQIGDTLFRIAQRYGTTVTAIVQANSISDPNRIDIGDTLVIP
jgi:LysM repeat protein